MFTLQVGARRANNYNAALVGELKRWNRKLEGENQRLFTVVEHLKSRNADGMSDSASQARPCSLSPAAMDTHDI